MKALLKEWLEFSKDVVAGCAAGDEELNILRNKTEKALASQLEPPVSKPIFIVYNPCFDGYELITAFEEKEDAEKYCERAKENYKVSHPIHLVKAC